MAIVSLFWKLASQLSDLANINSFDVVHFDRFSLHYMRCWGNDDENFRLSYYLATVKVIASALDTEVSLVYLGQMQASFVAVCRLASYYDLQEDNKVFFSNCIFMYRS